MNITLLKLLPVLLMLLVTAAVLYRLDRRMLRQWTVVVGRVVVVLLVLAVCLHYVFLWNKAWLNVLWVLLAGGVSTVVYCRKRWLSVPVFLGMLLPTFVAGLVVVALAGGSRLLDAWWLLPVMTVLQADALFVCRHGLSSYAMNVKVHQGLNEYLLGNGATTLEALHPFVVSAVKRAFTPVLSQLLLVGVVFVPSMLGGLLICGIEPLQAVAFLALLTAAALCSTLLSLLFTLYIYVRLK